MEKILKEKEEKLNDKEEKSENDLFDKLLDDVKNLNESKKK